MRFLKKYSLLLLVAALLLLPVLTAGCSSDSQPAATVTAFSITDDSGATVSFEKPVDTIVSLAPSNTELVYFVAAGDKLIGRTDYCNYPAEVSSVPSIGGYSKPNKEKVVTLDPDVVLATGIHISSGDVKWLQDQGLKVVVLDPTGLGGIMDNITLVGELTGNKAIAEQKVSELGNRIGRVTESTTSLGDGQKPSTLFVTWHNPLWTQGKGAFMDDVIQMAGGTNIFSDVESDVQVDTELAVTRNPQVILVVTGMGDNKQESYNSIVAADSPVRTTDACRNQRVALLDADLATRPGPRLIDALEQVSKILHPEIFH